MYYPHADMQFPSDAQRIQVVLGLLESGFGDRLLLAQDICFRSDLVQYGGHGYIVAGTGYYLATSYAAQSTSDEIAARCARVSSRRACRRRRSTASSPTTRVVF